MARIYFRIMFWLIPDDFMQQCGASALQWVKIYPSNDNQKHSKVIWGSEVVPYILEKIKLSQTFQRCTRWESWGEKEYFLFLKVSCLNHGLIHVSCLTFYVHKYWDLLAKWMPKNASYGNLLMFFWDWFLFYHHLLQWCWNDSLPSIWQLTHVTKPNHSRIG